MKNKGFLMAESMVSIVIVSLAMMSFVLIVSGGKHAERKMEQRTDQAVAKHMMRKTGIKQVKIHDQIYQK